MGKVGRAKRLEPHEEFRHLRIPLWRKVHIEGKKTLKWKDDPVPTIFTEGMKQAPLSVQPTAVAPPRKPPLKRNYQEDQYQNFLQQDVIHNISDLSAENAPDGFICSQDESLLYWSRMNSYGTFFSPSHDGFNLRLNFSDVQNKMYEEQTLFVWWRAFPISF